MGNHGLQRVSLIITICNIEIERKEIKVTKYKHLVCFMDDQTYLHLMQHLFRIPTNMKSGGCRG